MSGWWLVSEHPILFGGPMVRAILDGLKTMTRRVVKPQPPENGLPVRFWYGWPGVAPSGEDNNVLVSPYRRGGLLWVRETWAKVPWHGVEDSCKYLYRADDPPSYEWDPERGDRWSPSIFMPREASRITLRVTDVRVERLQDITEEDAVREGVQAIPEAPASLTDRTAFARLWDSLNAKRGHGWDVNPWVWVIAFERAA